MRSSFPLLTALILLISTLKPVAAQQPSTFGYVRPVPGQTSQAAYAIHLADQDESLPQVDAGSIAACGCAAPGCADRGCDDKGCAVADCCRPSLFDTTFASLEYMSWYNDGIHVPTLVTTSPAGTPQAQAGVLPGASVVFGNRDIDDGRQSAGRLTLGKWLDDCRDRAIVGRIYGVEGGAVRFGQSSTGNPIIGRPFFNIDPAVNREDALLIAFPGVSQGSVNVTAENDVAGAEVFFRTRIDGACSYRLDLVGGYQFNRIDSDLSISSQHTQGATSFTFRDVFAVDNEFHAGTLGLYAESYWDCWTVSALGKIGVGNMNQRVFIDGSNTVDAGGAVTTDGGLLAQPTNMGMFDRDVLVWAPEVNFKLTYAMTERLGVSVGYSFLYWTRVAFAGDQVDRVVNGSQLVGGPLVGPARPAFGFRDSDFWVQTIDVGVSYNY